MHQAARLALCLIYGIIYMEVGYGKASDSGSGREATRSGAIAFATPRDVPRSDEIPSPELEESHRRLVTFFNSVRQHGVDNTI